MSRFTLVLPALFLFALALPAQQQPSTPTPQKTPTYAAIPVEAIKQPNPVKSSPESLARAKKWWTLDCAMCHGTDGNGKGETADGYEAEARRFHRSRRRSKTAPTARSSTSSRTATTTCRPKARASRPKRIGTW